ncbi:MAG: hypothetical protein ABI823_05275 [Bryobacteraceae bacterium]
MPSSRFTLRRFLRTVAVAGVVLLAGCGRANTPASPPDPTREAWYQPSTEELASIAKEANALFANHDGDGAAALIKKAEPIANRLLSVPHPTLAAMEASSDLDDLYGRMLLSNRHYGWARLQFQKNAARWKNWQPRTSDTLKRLRQAVAAIEECDRRMME